MRRDVGGGGGGLIVNIVNSYGSLFHLVIIFHHSN